MNTLNIVAHRIPRGHVEVHGDCKDCGKRFTRNSKIGNRTPVYCKNCELK